LSLGTYKRLAADTVHMLKDANPDIKEARHKVQEAQSHFPGGGGEGYFGQFTKGVCLKGS